MACPSEEGISVYMTTQRHTEWALSKDCVVGI